MIYEQARNMIETGDIILVRGRSGILARLTRFFTRSPYTHSGQAFWMNGALWMNEINGGHNHAIPLSQLAGTNFDVYARPADINAAAAMDAIMQMLRTKIKYGFAAFVIIGLFDLLGIKVFLHWRQILVCSGYTAKTLCLAGWPECTYILSPAELARMLKLRFPVAPP